MIEPTTVDPTLDRLLRHMAWANAALIGQLAGLTDEALGLSSPRNEWTVAMILQHQVDAADRYAARLEGRAAPRGDRASRPWSPSSPRSPLAAPPSTRGSAPRRPSRTGRPHRRTRQSRSAAIDHPRPGDPPRDRASSPDRGRPLDPRDRRDRPRRPRHVGLRRRRGPRRVVHAAGHRLLAGPAHRGFARRWPESKRGPG